MLFQGNPRWERRWISIKHPALECKGMDISGEISNERVKGIGQDKADIFSSPSRCQQSRGITPHI